MRKDVILKKDDIFEGVVLTCYQNYFRKKSIYFLGFKVFSKSL
jgi:hypothetical protein